MKTAYWWGIRQVELFMSFLYMIPKYIRFYIKNRIINRSDKTLTKGKGSIIEKRCRFIFRHPGSILLGANVRLCRNIKIVIDGGSLEIGEGSTIGENCIFNCFDSMTIGKHLLTADNISFITNTHYYENINTPICSCGGAAKPIAIGDDCWIGINATILDSTIIGKHCIVGANSVVKGIFPDYCVIAGNPARIVKKYDFDEKRWIKCNNQKY